MTVIVMHQSACHGQSRMQMGQTHDPPGINLSYYFITCDRWLVETVNCTNLRTMNLGIRRIHVCRLAHEKRQMRTLFKPDRNKRAKGSNQCIKVETRNRMMTGIHMWCCNLG